MNGILWTQSQKDRALELRKEGFSARDAAEILTRENVKVCTKNMVVGLWDRNLPEGTLAPVPRNEYFVRVKKRFLKEFRALARSTSPAVASLMELKKGECRYPIGELDADDFRFCCAPVATEVNSSYCEEHHRRCRHVPRNFVGKKLADAP